ncbi:MAG TPA: winged helix-turn-helix domain-containing protein [Terriglobales bacterium]|nr:winged helix-turn-helix domain-containing protein [Terriglobales bacterium]
MAQPPKAGILSFGAFTVETETGILRKHGVRVKLGGQSFEVLHLLLKRPGELVKREELRAALWPADTFVDFEHGLNAAVNKLREALGDSAETPRYIETLPRRGYRFVGQLNEPGPDVVAAAYPSPEPPSVPMSTPTAGRRRRQIALLLAVLLVGAVVAFLDVGGVRSRILGGQVPRLPIHSLAVLPFDNLSGDPREDYLADGMTEALIGSLAQVRSFKVISRTSVLRYRKADRPPLPQIARELGVDAVIEGSVQREGDTVRISVQLIHGPTDEHLWANQYQREVGGVLALQGEVAQAIAREIHAQMTPQESTRLSRQQPINPESFELYVKARRLSDGFDLQGSNRLLEEAVHAAPDFAPAYASMAENYVLMAMTGRSVPMDLYAKAKNAARRALELDEDLAEAHVALGWARLYEDWDWDGVEQSMRQAIDLNPSSAAAHFHYSILLSAVERHPQAIAEAQFALQLDPLSPLMITNLGWRYEPVDPEKAAALFRDALAINPNLFAARMNLGLFHLSKGKQDEALAEFQQFPAWGAGGEKPLLAYAFAVMGKKQQAIDLLNQARHPPRGTYVSKCAIAIAYAALNDPDESFRWLDRAYDERDGWLLLLRWDRRFDPLRSDPRFQTLLARMKFPPPAKTG